MQPSMEACAWIHQAQDRSWRPYLCELPMRPCVHHRRMCTTLAGFPEMATSIAGGEAFQRWRHQSPEGPLQPGSATQDARSIKFSKTGRYSVPSTLARRQQFSWRRNQPEPLSERTTDGRCYYHFKTSFKPDGSVGAGGGRSSKYLNRRSCPDYPARRGD